MTFHVPDKYRIRQGPGATTDAAGNNGCFRIPVPSGRDTVVIASDRQGWEHLEVGNLDGIPGMRDLLQVRDLFWDQADAIVSFLPFFGLSRFQESSLGPLYKNPHHLWRPASYAFPIPYAKEPGYEMRERARYRLTALIRQAGALTGPAKRKGQALAEVELQGAAKVLEAFYGEEATRSLLAECRDAAGLRT